MLVLNISVVSARDFSTSNTVYIPELLRTVHLKKNPDLKEYAIEYGDLAEVGLKLLTPFDKSICAQWRQALKAKDSAVDSSIFQRSQMQLRLQILKMNPQAVADAVGPGWTDVGSMDVTKVAVDYRWEASALTVFAGAQVSYSAQHDIDTKLNSPVARLILNRGGGFDFAVTNTLFACDLAEGNVRLSLAVSAVQYSGFHFLATIRATDIFEVSQKIQKTSEILRPENSSIMVSDSLHEINSAGLLGYRLYQQGYGTEILKNGEFLKLYGKIFENGPDRPAALTADDADALVRSMMRTKYESKDFNISQELNLEAE